MNPAAEPPRAPPAPRTPPRLTRGGVAVTTAGFGLFGLGVAMGNLELLIWGAFPLLVLALALAGRARAPPALARVLSTRAPRRGEPFTLDVALEDVPRGGLVEVHAPLPPTVTLEAGSNVALLDRPDAFSARLRAHARGRQELGPVRVEAIDPLGVLGPLEGEAAPAAAVDVAPRRFAIRRMRARARARAASPQPERDEARLGMESTDFRELREYAWGDPPNAINWKATARRLSALGKRGGRMASPLVNEYEKEGKRTVFVLLDGGEALRVGTSLETGLDHGVEAAVAATRFFLARGTRVGAWTYGAASGPLAPPEAGSGQTTSLERALAPGEPDPTLTLPAALRTLHPHFVAARPTVVVITRVTPRNAPELADAARRLRASLGERRRSLPLTIVDVRALALAPAPDAAWRAARDLVAMEDADALRLVAATGARIVPWHPGVEDFRRALHRGGLA